MVKNMFLKVGHRGAKAYEPENTLKSFERAIKLGVDAIEFDVRQTKDKKLVVFQVSVTFAMSMLNSDTKF